MTSSAQKDGPTRYSAGCDVGGTFTDLVVIDRTTGVRRQFKSATTPDDLSAGIVATLELAAQSLSMELAAFLGSVEQYCQGTTAATNALAQRNGARVGLLQTRGFGDTLFIMRAGGRAAGRGEAEIKRFSKLTKPAPIVTKDLVVELNERIGPDGAVVAPLDENDVRAAVAALVAVGVDAIAVSFLWSFKNPSHEQLVRKVIEQEAPQLHVTLSSELIPRIKEYERTATCAINAYVGPPLKAGLSSLVDTLRERGLAVDPLIMQSNGGLASVTVSVDRAATLLMSGPAGGVVGSAELGRALGHANIVTADMGGTTFDVGLIVDGHPDVAAEAIVEQYLTGLASIHIQTIGAGGGSIATVRNGYLEVGPQSAGAVPGPVCYGQGGTEPTVTDADIVLGILDPDYFLGGAIELDADGAYRAIEEKIAKPLGISVLEGAAAIKTITDNKMADLIRRVTIERGHDPRDFVIYAYGGAGPTHASGFSAEVGAKALVIPLTAPVHSAFGIATAAVVTTLERSDPRVTPAGSSGLAGFIDVGTVNALFNDLDRQAIGSLVQQGLAESDVELSHVIDMRFRGQIYETAVPAPVGNLSPAEFDALVPTFVSAYEAMYGPGSAFTLAGIELVNFRVTASSAVSAVPAPALVAPSTVAPKPARERRVYSPATKDLEPTPVFIGGDLTFGHTVPGPALIEFPHTTVLVPAKQAAHMDERFNLVIEREN